MLSVEILVIRWQGAPWDKEIIDNPYFRQFESLEALELHCLEVAQVANVCEINARAEGRLLVNLHKSRRQRGEKLQQKIVNIFP